MLVEPGPIKSETFESGILVVTSAPVCADIGKFSADLLTPILGNPSNPSSPNTSSVHLEVSGAKAVQTQTQKRNLTSELLSETLVGN